MTNRTHEECITIIADLINRKNSKTKTALLFCQNNLSDQSGL